jgi:hypothetical protein
MRAREKKRISGRKRTIRIAYVAIALCAIIVRPLRYATDAEFRIDKPRMPLRPNESVLLGVRAFVGGKQNGAQIDWRTFFEPGQIARPHTIVIDYESIDGIACSTEMEMLNEGYRIGPIIVDTME